jgi:hypothetical protein
MTVLINKKETEVVDFLYSKYYIIQNMTKQMHSKSLAELLHKILTFESTEVKEPYLA